MPISSVRIPFVWPPAILSHEGVAWEEPERGSGVGAQGRTTPLGHLAGRDDLGDARRSNTIDCAALCLIGRRPLTRTGLGLLLVLLLSSISCSPFDSWLGFESSRRAYEKCRDENKYQPESCERELRARDQDYGEYERDSEDLWGCERTPEGCSPRGPATDEYGRPTS